MRHRHKDSGQTPTVSVIVVEVVDLSLSVMRTNKYRYQRKNGEIVRLCLTHPADQSQSGRQVLFYSDFQHSSKSVAWNERFNANRCRKSGDFNSHRSRIFRLTCPQSQWPLRMGILESDHPQRLNSMRQPPKGLTCPRFAITS